MNQKQLTAALKGYTTDCVRIKQVLMLTGAIQQHCGFYSQGHGMALAIARHLLTSEKPRLKVAGLVYPDFAYDESNRCDFSQLNAGIPLSARGQINFLEALERDIPNLPVKAVFYVDDTGQKDAALLRACGKDSAELLQILQSSIKQIVARISPHVWDVVLLSAVGNWGANLLARQLQRESEPISTQPKKPGKGKLLVPAFSSYTSRKVALYEPLLPSGNSTDRETAMRQYALKSAGAWYAIGVKAARQNQLVVGRSTLDLYWSRRAESGVLHIPQ